ncbi:deleted in malignant brain tumors 1 protein-like [Patiria miniata]|uniref:SRCR domain-containing protein n=1 Tax=Patiria miniata TaxID=46514 RepID=A0A914BJI3_PATMI|nr:deleted in malignant brain tumors 1 protein-like [Patiria miniata]
MAQEHDLRLTNGSTSMEGRLEIFFQGEWGTVCGEDSLKIEEASVVCRQLGFIYAVEVKSFGPGSGAIVIDDLNCNGNEASILDCYHDKLGKSNCGHGYDVGLVCSNVLTTEVPITYAPDVEAILNNGKFRLVDGPDPYQGRVEVFLYNARAWMPICNVDWDFTRALFVCKKLGFRPATLAGTGSYGAGAGQIANCSAAAFNYRGSVDSNWDSCQIVNASDAVGECSHDMAVDVICSGTEPGIQDYIRFVGGSQQSEGRVEIYNDNVWKGLCSDDWTMAEAQVSCRQQGLPPPPEVVPGGTFGSSKAGDILQVSLDCTGQEFSLATCPQMARQTPCASGDAAVRCGEPIEAQEFDLRLVNGETFAENRVEILHQGEWGTICHTIFDGKNKASVACHQLGFLYAEVATKSFGPQTENIVLTKVICNGNEERLVDCYHDELGTSTCSYGQDLGVVCSNVESPTPTPNPTPDDGELRLVGGPDPYQGRVEVYIAEEGKWATICGEVWDLTRANTICHWLEYRPPTSFGTGLNGGAMGEIANCPLRYDLFIPTYCELTNTCTHDMDAYVVCDAKEAGIEGQPRLVNGSERTEGRVEIYDQNAWRTLCADDLTLIGQQIVCRQLSLPFPSVETTGGLFGESPSYEMVEDVINCVSRETIAISLCDRTPRQTPCIGGAAAVQCGIWNNATEGDLRLSGGDDATQGRVEIYHSDQWGTICADHWDANDAEVVCHHLGFRNQVYFYNSAASRAGGTPVWLKDLMCQGKEERISECRAMLGEPVDCTLSSLAGVRCVNSPFTNYYEARLVGPYPNQGRLELLYEGAWWTVCDNDWDTKDAEVVCRQLGFASAVVALVGYETASTYGSGEGGILLYKLGCNGTEESIIKCPLSYPFAGSCRHREDVGVVCFSEDYPSDDPRLKPEDTGLSSEQIRNIVLGCLLGASVFFTVLGAILKANKKRSPEGADAFTSPAAGSDTGDVALTGVGQNEDAPMSYENAINEPGKVDPAMGTESTAEPSALPPRYETLDGADGNAANC